jgi:hypothetical protein|tara:strand:- start:1254 stop:1418 length:165 start_codon:yes stop_codon:yes gene_type:complete
MKNKFIPMDDLPGEVETQDKFSLKYFLIMALCFGGSKFVLYALAIFVILKWFFG